MIHEKRYKLILNGLLLTIWISFLSVIAGTLIGAVICLMRMSGNKFLNGASYGYIRLLQGIPVLVLLMLIYYVIFSSVHLSATLVAVIAFGMNFGAYASEIFRAGIAAVGKGQWEAAKASGFNGFQAFRFIVLPQALKGILPVYTGEFVSLVKMTSVVGYIAVEDLTKASDIIRSRTFDAFFPLLLAAFAYLLITWLFTSLLDSLAKRVILQS
jgi:polar amino acid transport system substrate-binding protein